MGGLIDYSTGAAFFRKLTEQSFVQLEQETNGHQYWSLVEDLLSRPISDKVQLVGLLAAAQVLRSLNIKGQHPPSASAGGRTSDLTREDTDTEKTACLAASLSTNTTIASDICQHTRQAQSAPRTDRNRGTRQQASAFNAAFYNKC